jgi:hypothetical protein
LPGAIAFIVNLLVAWKNCLGLSQVYIDLFWGDALYHAGDDLIFLVGELLEDGMVFGFMQSLQDDLAVIRTGRANPSLVERMSVEYYGSPVPLIQLATISVPEPRESRAGGQARIEQFLGGRGPAIEDH